MDTLLAFLAGSILTFFFVRRYLKTLAAPRRSAPTPAPAAVPSIHCPRCGKAIARDSSFCSGCGAPMALWNVHRAAVQSVPANGSTRGKPRPVINTTLCIGCGSCVDECPETGTLALVSGKAILAHAERCVGHAHCIEVCPTSAITLSYGSMLQTLRAPMVKENFETNISGIYIAGELSGMGLIKTAINEGRLAVESIKNRLEAAGLWQPPAFDPNHLPPVAGCSAEDDSHYEVLIVGAGPAGLSASLSAMQYGLRYVTLEQGEVASTIRNYPRQKFLMAEPAEMPLYGSLYVGDGTKEALLGVWETILSCTGVQVRTRERVETITRDGGFFRVGTNKGVYTTRSIVLALGKRGTPRKLDVPGEELGKVCYRLIEADSYNDCDILIVGGGDTSIEAALALSKASKNRVVLAYRGDSFARARERNRNLLREAEQQGRVHVMRSTTVAEILPASVRLVEAGRRLEIPNDYVFVLIGGESPETFLRKIGIQIVEKVIGAESTYEFA